MGKKIYLGIDYGTAYTRVCCYENTLEYVKFRGENYFPSALSYRDGKLLVGKRALKMADKEPLDVIRNTKSYLGNENKVWKIKDERYTSRDITQHLIREAVESAKKQYNAEECAAVITVPASFTMEQRDHMRQIATASGIEVIEIVEEPVAAAMTCGIEAYGYTSLLSINLGGSFLEIAFIEFDGRDYEIKWVEQNQKVSAEALTNAIVELCLEHLKENFSYNLSTQEQSGLEPLEYRKTMHKIMEASEKVKEELSTLEKSLLVIPSLISNETGIVDLQLEITREAFESKIQPLLEESLTTIRHCLEKNMIPVSSIDQLLLLGGNINIPAVSNKITETLKVKRLDVQSYTESVVIGAAVLAAGDKNLVKVSEQKRETVLSHSLGVKINKEGFCPILRKKMQYPCKRSYVFTTINDNQKIIKLEIFEGNQMDCVHQNHYYGSFLLRGIPNNSKGVPQIEVEFAVNLEKILTITARDRSTGDVLGSKMEIQLRK